MEKKIQFLVRQWKAADSHNRAQHDPADADATDFSKIWNGAGNYKNNAFEPDVEANWQKFKAKISTQTDDSPVRRLPIYGWYAAAAAVILILGLWFTFETYSSNAEAVIVATNMRQIKKVSLPDHTQVWLSKNSEITFEKSLAKSRIRTVKLRGEAFFDVQHNANQPFQVQTPHGMIEVLGTSFNVRALQSESQTEVQVVRGRVALHKKALGLKLEVPANFIGYIPAGNRQLTKEIEKNTKIFASTEVWRTRTVDLGGRTLGEAQEIMRRYSNTRIEFSNPGMANCVVNWTLHLDKLETDLKLLEGTGIFRLEKTSNGVFRLVGKPCSN